MWTSSRHLQRTGVTERSAGANGIGCCHGKCPHRAFEERIRTLVKFINEQQEGLGPPSPVDEPENEKLLQLGKILSRFC